MRELRARWLRSAALAWGLLAVTGAAAQAQPAPPVPPSRVALVVGEGAYRAGPLPAAPNDAGLVAQVLAGAGFAVTGARDLDGDGLRRALRDFLDAAGAAGPDGIAVLYFAGRAVQSDGDDFVVPVDARLSRPTDVLIEALRLADFTHALAALPIQARIVVVDGSYGGGPAPDTPGLALTEAEQGELLAFNAAPGTVAPATTGPYGAYAQAFVAAVKQGGVPVDEVFGRVRLAVNQATGGAAVPWDSDKLTRSFSFFDRAPNAPAVASAQVPFAALEKRPLASFPPAEAYDLALARDTLPAYTEFLAAFPSDPLARRVRLIVAVRREALFWRAALVGNAANSFWTYLARYPKGPHAADARRRLTRLSAAPAPPLRFAPILFDVPPPGPDDVVLDSAIVLDAPDLPPPPPPPVFLLPPAEIVVQPPSPPAGPVLLPVAVPVAIPFVRSPVEPGSISPPRGAARGYGRPRPYARAPNGDGLVVQVAPAPSVAPPAPPMEPQPPAVRVPRPPNPAVPPSPTLPVPARPAAPLPSPVAPAPLPAASASPPVAPRAPAAHGAGVLRPPPAHGPAQTPSGAEAAPATLPSLPPPAPAAPRAPRPAGAPARAQLPAPHTPDHPAGAAPAHPAGEAPPAARVQHEHGPACGHPGEPPCRP